MYYYNTCWITIESERMNYAKHIREYESQRMYEKSIVCSVPAREIGHEQILKPANDRWKPG